MFKKTLTTILATVTALTITALPVSAAEPGYVTVGDAAHGYVDVPADWHQDTYVLYYTAGELAGQAQDLLSWNNPEDNQSITLRRENRQDPSIDEVHAIANLCSWVGDQIINYHDEHLNPDMGDAGTIAGHKAFWASWTIPAQYMSNGIAVNYKTFYFVDDNYIYNIEASSWNGGDYTQALQAATTFHF